MSFFSQKSIFLGLGISILSLGTQLQMTSAQTVSFSDFSDVSAWQLNGNAAQAGSVLRLTPSALFQTGSAFLTDPISLLDENSFSTFFQFQFSNSDGSGDPDGTGGDGIVFTLQTVSNTAGNPGQGIGFEGLPNSFGVEFDTINNGAQDQNDGNHVGINVNGSVSSVALAPFLPRFNNGSVYSAWIDYDGITDSLEVRLSTDNNRPITPLLSTNLDLETVLGSSDAFVGFTSATGFAFNDHDILNFTFTNDSQSTPEPMSILGFLTLGILGGTSTLKRRLK